MAFIKFIKKHEVDVKLYLLVLVILGISFFSYGIYTFTRPYNFTKGLVNGVNCKGDSCTLDVSYSLDENQKINKKITTNINLNYTVGSSINIAVLPDKMDEPFVFTKQDQILIGTIFTIIGFIILLGLFLTWYMSPSSDIYD
jgi:hypothetical protein